MPRLALQYLVAATVLASPLTARAQNATIATRLDGLQRLSARYVEAIRPAGCSAPKGDYILALKFLFAYNAVLELGGVSGRNASALALAEDRATRCLELPANSLASFRTGMLEEAAAPSAWESFLSGSWARPAGSSPSAPAAPPPGPPVVAPVPPLGGELLAAEVRDLRATIEVLRAEVAQERQRAQSAELDGASPALRPYLVGIARDLSGVWRLWVQLPGQELQPSAQLGTLLLWQETQGLVFAQLSWGGIRYDAGYATRSTYQVGFSNAALQVTVDATQSEDPRGDGYISGTFVVEHNTYRFWGVKSGDARQPRWW